MNYFSSITNGLLGSVSFNAGSQVYVNGRLINGLGNNCPKATKLKLVLCDDDGNELSEMAQLNSKVEITIQAETVEEVQLTSGEVNIKANSVGSVTSTSGDIKVEGNITGNVSLTSGDVRAHVIHGRCSTVSGDIFGSKKKK